MPDDRLLHHLSAVLDAEKDAILCGGYDRLETLAGRRAALFADLPGAGADAATLRRISRAFAQNQALLRAAIAGIRDATARLGAMRATLDGFQAYGREGARETVTSARPNMERKV